MRAMSKSNKSSNNKSKKREPEQQKAGLVTRLLADDQLRSAIWMGAATFLVFYLGAMIIFRLLLLGGEGSRYDSIFIAVIALIAAIVAGRKRYNDDI
ncbi:hypothetical protein HMPREF2651_01955 [Corynebacterium sp. HMSC063A05]|nr:hypothetical protein F6I18_09030 [Corynebacterium amycolatum]MBC6758203.1 hypothetical protein [Corynebacterium sp. LK24]OFM86689.1 hypothetical protein HMPREF2651_01955 [Corynebacterium sp. HMSC063A05]OFN08778.1 hypothetical protein HMPREF2614_05350 [Corynebacterium sp. HMSC074C11]OFR92365.1 hypothetical protein HMPREF2860_03405 [Corynebacterium sp. HMSC064E10]OFU54325.1 hypothetical protein HMPREF3122_09405 [Corynebacterium sp. HMSC11H10]OHQ76197.1 hypothetical protein HMPREF2708_06765 [